MIIRMPQAQVDELGECIEKGLHYFGKAMSLYSQMKHSSEDGMYERNMRDMDYRYPHMREGWENYEHDMPRYPEERRGYRRY